MDSAIVHCASDNVSSKVVVVIEAIVGRSMEKALRQALHYY